MKKRFLFALSTLLIIITLAVPVFAQSTMDTVQALNKKGWKLEEDKIPGWWSFDSIYSHEIAYSEELKNCRDLVIASAEKNDHPVGSLIFMTDEDKAFFDNVLGPTAMWDALARWNTTGILSINGVPWQNSPYRDEYLAQQPIPCGKSICWIRLGMASYVPK